MNEKTKKELPKEIEKFLDAYAEWYDRNHSDGDAAAAGESNPNDPPPPPPGPIKP